MSVSGVRAHIRYNGDEKTAKELLPLAFKELAVLDDLMKFQGLEQYSREIKVPGGAIRVSKCFGEKFIYIYSSGGGDYFKIYEDVTATLHLFLDPIVCKNSVSGEDIDCTHENDCTGANAEYGDCEATRMFKRIRIEKSGSGIGATEEPYFSYDEDGFKVYDTQDISSGTALNSVCYSLSKTSTHGGYHCYQSWSKTLDQYTAHAILYYDDMAQINFWCVAVDVLGQAYRFKVGEQYYTSWPNGGYKDVFWVTNTDPYNTTPGYKAFDLWKEEVEEENGETRNHCFLSMTADTYDRVFVWDLTLNEVEYFDLTWRQEFAQENGYYWPHFPDGWIDRHIRLIGLAKRTVYWAVQQHDFSIPVGQPNAEGDAIGRVYWQDDEGYGSTSTDTSECGFEFAVFNEFTREIEWMECIACHEDCEFVEGGFSGPHCYGTEHTLNINGVQRGSYFVSGDEGVAGYVCPRSSSCAGEVYYFSIYGCPLQFVGDNDVRYCPPEDSWCCGNTWNRTYWYWDCNSEVYECIVSGLRPGSYERKRRTRTCKSVGNGCEAYLDPYCVTTNDAGTPSCGYCTHEYYTSYTLSGRIGKASILPSGIEATFSGTEANGEIAVCDNPSGDSNTYAETDYDDLYGDYDSQYGISSWPFYPSFAIIVEANACSEIIERTESKYKTISGELVERYVMPTDEDEIEAKCKLGGDSLYYAVIRNNDRELVDSFGNVLNDNTDDSDFFFFVQNTNKRYRKEEHIQ